MGPTAGGRQEFSGFANLLPLSLKGPRSLIGGTVGVFRSFALALAVLSFSGPALAQGGYRLNPGDLLEISVWKEEGMERQVLVLPDGMISFPLAGHLLASGKTAAQVQDELVERIKRYISEPVVTVTVADVTGHKIYVIGQVNQPGEFTVTRQIDVMQALSLAGGLTPFGDEDDIKILRREGEQQQAFDFDYSAVKRGDSLATNLILKAGDVVVVPD